MKKIFLLSLALILIFPCIFSCAPAERAYSVSEYRTTMQFYEDFKILQLTDLHFGIESDLALQLEIVKNAINAEKPDLIILTGDSFMYSSKGVVDSLFYTLNEECKAITAERGRLTKFTFTFGNHDTQGGLGKEEQLEIYRSFPNFVETELRNPEDIGSCCITVKDSKGYGTSYLVQMKDGKILETKLIK